MIFTSSLFKSVVQANRNMNLEREVLDVEGGEAEVAAPAAGAVGRVRPVVRALHVAPQCRGRGTHGVLQRDALQLLLQVDHVTPDDVISRAVV